MAWTGEGERGKSGPASSSLFIERASAHRWGVDSYGYSGRYLYNVLIPQVKVKIWLRVGYKLLQLWWLLKLWSSLVVIVKNLDLTNNYNTVFCQIDTGHSCSPCSAFFNFTFPKCRSGTILSDFYKFTKLSCSGSRWKILPALAVRIYSNLRRPQSNLFFVNL